MQFHHGVTRVVVLVGSFAIKFPRWTMGTMWFTRGQCHNLKERDFWRSYPAPAREHLCPCYFCLPFGLFSIMRRAAHLPDDDPNGTDYHNLLTAKGYRGFDSKTDNLGMIDGQLVILDYGDLSFFWEAPDA